jgi:hypothetical protein
MWPWIVENKEWVFSGIGVTVLAVLWWLLRKLFPRAAASNIVTQAPVVTVSPTFNLSPTLTPAKDPEKKPTTDAPARSAQEVEAGRPNLYSLPPRIWFASENGTFGFEEGGETTRAAIATFRMAKPGSDRRGTHITARLSYRIAGARGISDEFCRVNYGVWIEEDFNSVTFTLTDTKELILVWEANGKLLAIQDNRHSVSKFKEPSYYELAQDEFFINVTLVDEIYGTLITYTYKVESDPFKVSEIIRMPRL